VMTEIKTVLGKIGGIGAAGGWSERMLCPTETVSGREMAALFCFQTGHWSWWKRRYI